MPYPTVPSLTELEPSQQAPAGPRGLPDLPRRVAFFALQFLPMALLAFVFGLISPRLSNPVIDGRTAGEILLVSACLVPLLSQAVAGAVFRSFGEDRDPRNVAAAALRATWPALVVIVPVLAMLGFVLRAALDWSLGAIALCLVLVLSNLVFAGLLTPAYVTMSLRVLTLAWSTYALVLWLAPTALVLAPLTAAGVVTLMLMSQARGTERPTRAGWSSLAGGAGHGLTQGAALWVLPPAAVLTAPDLPAFAVYLALVPGLIVQLWADVVRMPVMWQLTESFQGSLDSETTAGVQSLARRLTRMATRTWLTCVRVGLITLAVGLVVLPLIHPQNLALVYVIMLGAVVGSLAMVEVTLLSLLGERGDGQFVAVVVGALALLAVVGPFSPAVAIALVVAGELIALAVLFLRRRQAWRHPEYTAFWSKAVSL